MPEELKCLNEVFEGNQEITWRSFYHNLQFFCAQYSNLRIIAAQLNITWGYENYAR